jgi:hypothetical protein
MNENEFTNFEVDIPSVDYMTIKKQAHGNGISGGEVLHVQLAIQCLRPFNNSPAFTVNFKNVRERHSYSLQLPITAASFFEAIPTDKATYMTRWKSLESEKTESQEIFQLTKKIDSAYLNNVRSIIIPALHIGAAIGLDSDTTVTGSCSFQTGTVRL